MKIREDFPMFLNEQKLDGIGVELGVYQGYFSEHILKHWKGKELIMIDIWAEQSMEIYPDGLNVPIANQQKHLAETLSKVYQYGNRATIIRSDSVRAASFIKDHSLDFVYIDANHAYDAVKQDIQNWHSKVKSGGYLCGHDYPFEGVKIAVDEFSAEVELPILTTPNDWSSWFIKL